MEIQSKPFHYISIGLEDFQSYLILYTSVLYILLEFILTLSFHFYINSRRTERLAVNYPCNLQKIAYKAVFLVCNVFPPLLKGMNFMKCFNIDKSQNLSAERKKHVAQLRTV